MSQEHQTDKTTTHRNRQTTEQERSSVGDVMGELVRTQSRGGGLGLGRFL